MMRDSFSRTKHSGNTLTGFILGLVVGLSIAVVVALVINKASTPFMNKNTKGEKTDTPAAQMQDPNKPLFGSKEPVAQAAKEIAASKAEISKLGTASKPAEAAPASTATAATTANKGDPAVDDKFIYFLQVGAFKETADAEAAKAKLALIGVEASISDKSGDSGVLHRVRVGPFDHADAMNKMRSKLSENGVEAAIIRSAK